MSAARPTRSAPAPAPAPADGPARLPRYALYGEEQAAELDAERLHCESIAQRSRLHGWEIRPHRHEALFQLLYIHGGQVQASMDGDERVLDGPCVLCVPAQAAHGFRFSPRVDGWVITVLQSHLWALLAAEPALRAALLAARAAPLQGEHAEAVHEAVAALRRELGPGQPWRALALDAALVRLAVVVNRAGPAPLGPTARGGARALRHAERYRALVERHYRDAPALAALARELGITPTQLNRVCHAVHGQGALAMLHGRIALEAQRDLAYTTLSIKQIALGLGFADAAYFTRFFRRTVGCTPSQWRGRQPAGAHD